jgi:hypothetical protein
MSKRKSDDYYYYALGSEKALYNWRINLVGGIGRVIVWNKSTDREDEVRERRGKKKKRLKKKRVISSLLFKTLKENKKG